VDGPGGKNLDQAVIDRTLELEARLQQARWKRQHVGVFFLLVPLVLVAPLAAHIGKQHATLPGIKHPCTRPGGQALRGECCPETVRRLWRGAFGVIRVVGWTVHAWAPVEMAEPLLNSILPTSA